MEILVGPFENERVALPHDVKNRCNIIRLEMFLLALKLYIVKMIAMLASGSRSDSRQPFTKSTLI
jgi:hypothetical protein